MSQILYLVEAIGLDRAKVGMAADPLLRLRGLDVGSPVHLRLLAVGLLPGVETDKSIVRSVRHLVRPVKGEWFFLSDLYELAWPELRSYFSAFDVDIERLNFTALATLLFHRKENPAEADAARTAFDERRLASPAGWRAR